MNDKRLQKIFMNYGMDAQLEKAIEELDELKTEIGMYLGSKLNKKELTEEIADVFNMILQIVWALDAEDEVRECMDFKIKRTLAEIEAEKGIRK